MEFAVFSDVHGNIYALNEMLRRAEEFHINHFIFCGDIVGYFLHQEEVIGAIRQLPNLYAVQGNHDHYYISTRGDRQRRESCIRKYGRSYGRSLTLEAESYLENLPQSLELSIEGKKILVAHGSVGQHLEGRVYPDTEVEESAYAKYDFVFLGHTHYRMLRKAGRTILLNPGSLGQPRDREGYSFCIVNTETEECRFRTVHPEQKLLLKELMDAHESAELIRYLKGKMEGIT